MAPEGGREKYALVLWLEDPRSADVVLKSDVVPDHNYPILLPKQERRVIWNGKPYPALIVATGLKTHLGKLKVSRDGELLTGTGPQVSWVTTRKAAIAALESRAAKSQADAIADLDNEVLINSDAPRQQRQQPVVTDEVLEALSQKLKTLPCYAEPDELMKDHYVLLGAAPKIYALKSDLHFFMRKFDKRPSKFFTKLLKHLLTEEVTDSGHLSITGRKGTTVAIPEDIFKAALSYSSLNSRGRKFDPSKTVTNMLTKIRNKKV